MGSQSRQTALTVRLRSAEHPSPGIVIALAEHLGEGIPANLLELLYADRQAEGAYENDGPPDLIRFSTQADNGDELGFTAPRDKLDNAAIIASIADRIVSGEAERSGGRKPAVGA